MPEAQNGPKSHQIAVSDRWGSNQKETVLPRKLRKTIPDSVVTFFSILGPLLLWGPPRALQVSLLAACCCCCWLLDAQAPPKWPNNWINRLRYYVLQLGDPKSKRYIRTELKGVRFSLFFW